MFQLKSVRLPPDLKYRTKPMSSKYPAANTWIMKKEFKVIKATQVFHLWSYWLKQEIVQAIGTAAPCNDCNCYSKVGKHSCRKH